MDEVTGDLQLASILQTIGVMLLLFDAIVVNFVWVGFRDGSYFWLYWTIVEGSAGFVMAMVGSFLKSRSGRRIPRLDTNAEMEEVVVDRSRAA